MSDIPKGPAAHISQPPPESILHNLHGYCNLLGCKQRQAEWLPVLSLLESMNGLWMDGLGWLRMAWDGLGWLVWMSLSDLLPQQVTRSVCAILQRF